MNRLEEYEALLQELEMPMPELDGTLERAQKRKSRRNNVFRPVIGTAAAFLLFVLLVNFSTPIAYACSQIPVLRELAEAVTFSPSLSDAVENEYVQPMNLVQTDGDVTAKVEYLIVDQKQVNVFYRLFSDVYTKINADPRVYSADGTAPPPCSHSSNGWDEENGELRSITIDFVDENVPDSLRLNLKVRDFSMSGNEEPLTDAQVEEDFFEPIGPAEEEYIAEFEFLLEFDPQFTAVGKSIEVHQTVELDGQKITITDVEIYPSHLRIDIEDDAENSAWLTKLYFYIETDYGMKFEPVSNGITATGSGDGKSMASFRAESTYFYDAKHLKIVITGAEWLRKDMEKLYINLKTGETGELPEGVAFHSAKEVNSGWILEMKAVQREEGHHHQILGHQFYDAQGNVHDIRSWSSTTLEAEESEDGITYIIEEVPLADYHEEEVWVEPSYSHEWFAENPVVVEVQ